jgi:hypothetical protein
MIPYSEDETLDTMIGECHVFEKFNYEGGVWSYNERSDDIFL